MKKNTQTIIKIILLLLIIVLCYLFKRLEINIISISILILLLIIICIIKKIKYKNVSESSIDDFEKTENSLEVINQNEDIIQKQIEEIKTDKEKIKEIEFDKTVQIPINEIQNQIKNINKKLTKQEKNEKVGENTVILFSKDDIKEIIKKELGTNVSDDGVK